MEISAENRIKNPHNSFKTWYILKAREHKKWGMALRASEQSGNAQLWFTVGLLVAAAIGGAFTGISISQSLINPPLHLTGICASPAQITNGGCYYVSETTGANGQVQKSYIPAGVVYQNGKPISGNLSK